MSVGDLDAAEPTTGSGTGQLAAFVDAGVLSPADVWLAERLGAIVGDQRPPVLLAAALALRAPRYGHVCVELEHVAERITVEPAVAGASAPPGVGSAPPVDLPWPELTAWRHHLDDSPMVRGGEPGETPLVLDDGRLYLDRYWQYERQLAAALRERAVGDARDIDPAWLTGQLDRLFGEPVGPDRQRLAAALALLRRLTVIAGGPGTGKTYTVTRLLALLYADASTSDHRRPLRAALAAPTGKAAGRLQESLREGLATLDVDLEVRDALERTPAFTLHRLLGVRRDSSSRFRHDADDPLPHDVVIVDEASMVSLPLMAKLVDAVRPDARLVLLGDRDQLASVEAGAAFGDICGPAGSRPELRLSPSARDELVAAGVALGEQVEVAEGPGVWDAIVRLDRFRRFGEASSLGAVAAAIQREDTAPGGTLRLLRAGAVGDEDGDAGDGGGVGDGVLDVDRGDAGEADRDGDGVRWLDPTTHRDARRRAEDAAVAAYARYLRAVITDDVDAAQALDELGRLRVLCALRRGPDGAQAWNQAIEQRLAREIPGFDPTGRWYPGRPILVTENDDGVRLRNGDVGVILREGTGDHVAVFPATDGSLRTISPARLPACETTFAMTIHKSQGSQFDHAIVVLPGVSSPILTRELVYTAITRARSTATVHAPEAILREALTRPIQRATGLQPRLWDRPTVLGPG